MIKWIAIFILFAFGHGAFADQSDEYVLAQITLQSHASIVLKMANQVAVVPRSKLLKSTIKTEVTDVGVGDRIQFVDETVYVESDSKSSPLVGWIGKKKSDVINETSVPILKKDLENYVCKLNMKLGAIDRIEFAKPGKDPVALIGDFEGKLKRGNGIPKSAKVTSSDVSLLAVQNIEDLKNKKYMETGKYSVTGLTVDCK